MKVLIIEDEPAAARRLKKLITEIRPEVEILPVLETITDSVHFFRQTTLPDLVLLDIHLADGSSFEIFRHVSVTVPIIFTTAYDEYALEAFQVNTIDYLLKPIKRERLILAFNKLEERQFTINSKMQEVIVQLQPKTVTRFLVRLGQQIKLLQEDDIAYAYTEDRVTFLITNEGKRYPIEHSLEKLDNLLDDANFFRINRQFIISLSAILEMHTYSKGRVKLILNPATDKDTIVSTDRSPVFKKWLNAY